MSARIGLIGATGHAGYVLDGLREIEGASLCAVAPGLPEEDLSSHPVVREHGPRFHADPLEMLDAGKLDVVAVNTFFYLNSRFCREALERGIPAFCEKPLVLDLPDLRELRAGQEKTRVPVGIMLAFRYDPLFRAARELVRTGAIGEPALGYA